MTVCMLGDTGVCMLGDAGVCMFGETNDCACLLGNTENNSLMTDCVCMLMTVCSLGDTERTMH